MNQGPPSLAALASAGRPLPTRIINGYNTSAAIGVDINRVYEIGSGPVLMVGRCRSEPYLFSGTHARRWSARARAAEMTGTVGQQLVASQSAAFSAHAAGAISSSGDRWVASPPLAGS